MADKLIMKIVVSVLMLGETGNAEGKRGGGITPELKHGGCNKPVYFSYSLCTFNVLPWS